MGINVIRLPLVPQTLNANDPQGTGSVLKNHPSVRIANSRLALETMIQAADAANIEVLLDMHSCSNYVGWRKGRLDARPPWVDADSRQLRLQARELLVRGDAAIRHGDDHASVQPGRCGSTTCARWRASGTQLGVGQHHRHRHLQRAHGTTPGPSGRSLAEAGVHARSTR